MASAHQLIESAYRYWVGEIPALERLKLVIRLELRGRGDVQVFGVRTPGPEISKGEPDDPRIEISVSRSRFNELAAEGKVQDWRQAYEHGDIKVGGDPDVVKLLGTVVARHISRSQVKRVR